MATAAGTDIDKDPRSGPRPGAAAIVGEHPYFNAVEVAHAPLAGVEGAEPVYLVTAIAGEDEPYLGLGHGTPAEDAALLVVVIVVPLVFVSVGIVARVRTGSGVGHRILGIIAIGIGFAVPRLPALTLAAIVLFVGAAWLVSSILETVEAVHRPRRPPPGPPCARWHNIRHSRADHDPSTWSGWFPPRPGTPSCVRFIGSACVHRRGALPLVRPTRCRCVRIAIPVEFGNPYPGEPVRERFERVSAPRYPAGHERAASSPSPHTHVVHPHQRSESHSASGPQRRHHLCEHQNRTRRPRSGR
ncbi:MAG: hypothetical protein F4X18_01140 [Acidimicrobiia bacterium]|nr:hypothetical protein [Acidimicrobiia bacterium]